MVQEGDGLAVRHRRHVMRRDRWILMLGTGCFLSATLSGCVSLDDYRLLQALNRNLDAEKVALSQELFDCRSGSDALRSRTDSFNRELSAKDELITNLRTENQLLDDMRRTAQAALEKLDGQFDPIMMATPKLPEQLDSALKQFADDHPDAVIRYYPSDMVLQVHSDASYLSESRARSRVAGQFFMGSTPKKGQPIQLNGSIRIQHEPGGKSCPPEKRNPQRYFTILFPRR